MWTVSLFHVHSRSWQRQQWEANENKICSVKTRIRVVYLLICDCSFQCLERVRSATLGFRNENEKHFHLESKNENTVRSPAG